MTTTMTRVYSPKQHWLIMKLADEHEHPIAGHGHVEAQLIERLFDLTGNHEIFDPESDKVVTSREAGNVIDWLKELPRKQSIVAQPQVGPGMYENEDGVFIVKRTQDKQRLYAKRMIEITGDRLNHADRYVKIEFEYAPGAIRTLRPEHKMSLEHAKELSLRYGKCIVCGHGLKAAKSVERLIGPVCIKSFAA